jgi:hypothetical protein
MHVIVGLDNAAWGIENALARISLHLMDSFTKLSTLYILSIAIFVQPSSLTTASISSRKGWMYSGFVARWYSACVKVCSTGFCCQIGVTNKRGR